MPYGGPNIITVGSQGGKVLFSTSSANAYSGVLLIEAWGCKWYQFQTIGGATTTTISIYGTLDPNSVIIGNYATQAGGGIIPNPNYPAPGSPGGNWFLLEAPAQQGSASNVVNPMTKADGSQYLIFTGVTLRAVCVTSGATQTGTSTVLCIAGY